MRLHEGMICPVCETGEIRKVSKNVKFEYKGQKNFIERKVFECQECKEFFFDDKDEREIEKMLTDERRRIDSLLTSDEIRAVRKIFGMTQERFAEALGVGRKNFARYESGVAMQGRNTDNLLRVLRDFPGAMRSICKQGLGVMGEKSDRQTEIFSIPVRISRRKVRKISMTPKLEHTNVNKEEDVIDHAV